MGQHVVHVLNESVSIIHQLALVVAASRLLKVLKEAHSRVSAVVGEKGGDSGGRICVVIQGKLGRREPVDPIVLKIGAIAAQVLLKRLIGAFGLTVGLRVKGRRQVSADAKDCAQTCEKGACELSPSI